MRLLNFALLLAALACGGLYAYWSNTAAPPAGVAPPPAAGVFVPATDFPFNGRHLSDLRGNIVLLNFWASWCAPCQKEFPQMTQLAAKYSNVIFLAVSVDHDEAAMQRFLATQNTADANIILVHDAAKAIAQDIYGTIRYPETYLIGPDLTLRQKYVGLEMAWDSPEFAAQLVAMGARPR